MAQQLTFKVYVGALGDFLRTSAGEVQVFSSKDEADAAARAHRGMVLPGNASSPGGFDRTWA